MIGLDTNVLVRFLVDDDREQQDRAGKLLRRLRNSGQRAFLSALVLCETAWVLGGSYGYSKDQVLDALESLADSDVFQLEDEAAYLEAIRSCRSSAGGFADHFIGCRNLQAGCSTTMTFDKKLRRAAGFSIL